MINADMRMIVEAAKLTFVATVRADGSPSLSPKGSARVYDDEHIAFMNIASPGTIANLTADPRIEMNVVDFLRRRGYRFTGTATIHGSGTSIYQWLHSWLLDLNGPDYPAHEAVLVHIDHVQPITSPAYTFGGGDETALVAEWSKKYQVVHSEMENM
ncbi:pyridoxamine 5'-phosphate oxidase family protein [Amycolatopsis sp. NPDC023774]|uniref:pyridoxamine 5'-phosphate oxidase family protein n=1 Tax=Amycolatopsis sp. NPDC023774 TaxID=3155015 RepID=UPI0033FEA2BE